MEDEESLKNTEAGSSTGDWSRALARVAEESDQKEAARIAILESKREEQIDKIKVMPHIELLEFYARASQFYTGNRKETAIWNSLGEVAKLEILQRIA